MVIQMKKLILTAALLISSNAFADGYYDNYYSQDAINERFDHAQQNLYQQQELNYQRQQANALSNIATQQRQQMLDNNARQATEQLQQLAGPHY